MKTWQLKDKNWLKERKEAWKPIKKNLQESDQVNRDDIQACEKYFLRGERVDVTWGIVPELYELWFHPDHSEENWLRILGENRGVEDFITAKRQFGHRVDEYVSEYGWMGGLEERFVKFFYPSPDPNATKEVFGKVIPVGLVNPPVYELRTLGEWLTAPASSPYFEIQYLLEHIWQALYLVEQNKGSFNYLEVVLSQCANFVEPKGFPGDDTPQRRCAERLRSFLEKRETPPCLQEVWEVVRTREGRSRWFDILVDEFAFESKNDIYGKHFKTTGRDNEWGFGTLVVHDTISHQEFFDKITHSYNQLGFSRTQFNPEKLDAVDLGSHLTPMIKRRLGYEDNDPVPGYRYRLKTNAEYLDSEKGCIDIDLIMPVISSKAKDRDLPVFFVLPRPAAPYRIFETVAYPLNVRLVRRVFKRETGHDLLRYVYNKKPTTAQKLDPFYHADYQPFINNRRAFEDKPEYDFPTWNGEPLPSLFP